MSAALLIALALVQHEHHAPAVTPVEQAAPADPHAGHAVPSADPHAGHDMSTMAVQDPGAAPPIPTDHAAERFYPASAMAAARAVLRQEHSGGTYGLALADIAELRSRDGADAAAFEGEGWFGDDGGKWVVKARGEHVRGQGWEKAELQALRAWPIGPYFDLRGGARYDLAPKGRSYATFGVEGLAPYWFHVNAAAFLSDRGELSARTEGSYDLRLTQKLILQPRLEADLAEAGAARLEGGLRLRYEFRREFAPYVGLVRERAFGPMIQAGERTGSTAVVVGVRAWM